MPSKFIVRNFSENTLYHIFNSGLDNKNIFIDEKDYNFFKVYLFIYTRPIEEIMEKFPDFPKRLHNKNLSKEVELVGYSFMPNHFHIILKPITKEGVSKLMKQIANAYTLYFNQKHQKSGRLFVGRYKATHVPDDLITPLLRSIHKEPTNFSSFNDYCGQESMLPCSVDIKSKILSKFSHPTKFVEYHQAVMGIATMHEKIKPYLIEDR